MRSLPFSLTCCSLLLLFGCSKEPGVPLSFYLSDQESRGPVVVPTNAAAFVVTQVEGVGSEAAHRKVTIKLLASDASAFEKLTRDNLWKTLVVVQGTNVLATPKISDPIPARGAIVFRIGTNVNFENTYRDLLKLSEQ
jgi:hypothetical protein